MSNVTLRERVEEGVAKIGILCYNNPNNNTEGGERQWRWKVIALSAGRRER
jgi:hypothetical protein